MSLENAQMVQRINRLRKEKLRAELAAKRTAYEKEYYENKTKKVRRFKQLQKTYGITEAQYNAILVYQGNKCGICRIEEPRRGWVIDHCHATGKIRGILCHPCNHVLGFARDNKQTLQSAYFYLAHNGFRLE